MIPVLDLSMEWPDTSVLSRADNPTADRSPLAEAYADYGFVIARGLLDDDTIDRYCEGFERVHPDRTAGWQYCTPYMHHPFVADLVCDRRITDVAEEIVGAPMGVHLNLSDWRSTQRNWHQDGYLNPDSNLDWYVAAWIALDDIHSDAGPFEWIPGSHRMFGVIRNQLMVAALPPEWRGPDWPRHSEKILTPWFEDRIDEMGLDIEVFAAHKGDVLFWHPRTLHRGSTPRNPDLERRAMIAHYSSIHHRPDFPLAVEHPAGGHYFPINERVPT